MLGSETLADEGLIMEGAGKEGVAEGGIAEFDADSGGEPKWSQFRRRLCAFAASPLVVGLSKFWTPMGRDNRRSGGVDDCGGGRAETLGVGEGFEAASWDAEGELVLWMGGRALDPRGGSRFDLSSCR